MPCNLDLVCLVGMPSNLHFSNTDFQTLPSRSCSSKGSERSYQVDKEIQATFSMYCNRQQSTLSTASNSQIISLVYRMVIMYDRKIKYVAYISRLKCNHLNQRAQMCFCKKSPSALSKFLLKTFSTFTSSENLRFFFHVYIQRM